VSLPSTFFTRLDRAFRFRNTIACPPSGLLVCVRWQKLCAVLGRLGRSHALNIPSSTSSAGFVFVALEVIVRAGTACLGCPGCYMRLAAVIASSQSLLIARARVQRRMPPEQVTILSVNRNREVSSMGRRYILPNRLLHTVH
jgi:hypothetical protein